MYSDIRGIKKYFSNVRDTCVSKRQSFPGSIKLHILHWLQLTLA